MIRASEIKECLMTCDLFFGLNESILKNFFHGTGSIFDKFTKPGYGTHGIGFYFTPKESEARYFAKSLYGGGESKDNARVINVELKVKKPFNTMSLDAANVVAKYFNVSYRPPKRLLGPNEHYSALESQMRSAGIVSGKKGKTNFNEKIKEAGFDAIEYDMMKHVIVFDPAQIKIVGSYLLSEIESVRLVIEGKAIGKLYHFLSPDNLFLILAAKKMKPLAGSQPMDIGKKYLHYKNDNGNTVFYGVSTTRNPIWKPNQGQPWGTIRLTMDGDKISNTYPIKSYNDFWQYDDFAQRKRNDKDEFYAQAEEKIITDRNGVKDPLRYIIKVDVLDSAEEEFKQNNLDKMLQGVDVKFVPEFKAK